MHSRHSRTPRGRRLKTALVTATALTLLGVAGISMAAVDDSAGTSARTLATEDELIKLRDKAFADLRSTDIPGLDGFSVGIDPVSSKIGVHLFAPKGLLAAAIEQLPLGDDATVTVHKGPAPTPNTNVSGGATIANSLEGNCTAGFAVSLDSGLSAKGTEGFLTAGHCFDPRKPANQHVARIGSVAATGFSAVYGPSDHGIYVINDSPRTNGASPTVTDDSGTHPVTGITQPTVGMSICKHGITTGTTCGKVLLLQVKASYGESRIDGVLIRPSADLSGMIMSDLCTEPGDSGGAVYTSPAAGNNTPVNAVAVHSGGQLVQQGDKFVCNEKAGGQNIAYHTPISQTAAPDADPFNEINLKLSIE
jgi:hypothetical protein